MPDTEQGYRIMADDLEYSSEAQDMANDCLSEQEIQDLIINFNLDETVNELNRYYSTQTTWEIIKQSRRETSHTQFLNCFFDNKDFNADPNAGPIKKLIVLLLKWSKRQKEAYFDEELAKSIYNGSFSIISYKVEPEKQIKVNPSGISPVYGDGSIDIFITVNATINDKPKLPKTIHIVIENKIDAPETTKSFDSNGEQISFNKRKTTPVATVLYQTDAYYQYATQEYNGDTNLFVYLKPTDCSLDDIDTAECNCKKYIQINYQELLDYILQPVCEMKDISLENVYRLNDYIKTLGQPSETEDDNDDDINNSNKKITIMAMENKERELLKQFFAKNEKLIRAAINALGDEELSKNMAENIGPQGRPKPRRTYTINNGNKIIPLYEALEEFIKFRLQQGRSVSEINDEINDYIGGKRINVSDNQTIKVYQEKKHYGEIDGTNIRYTKEWSDSVEEDNFAKFREKVNK